MTTATALLPCPFCGAHADACVYPFAVSYQIRCSNLDGCAVRPYIDKPDEEAASQAWNRRALAAPADSAPVAQLQVRLCDLTSWINCPDEQSYNNAIRSRLYEGRRLYAAPRAPAPDASTEALRDVIAERERQQSVEGWTPEHDDQHRNGAMARAAAAYSLAGSSDGRCVGDELEPSITERLWPQDWEWRPKGRRSNLVRAGALILAEIERLDRAALSAADHGDAP